MRMNMKLIFLCLISIVTMGMYTTTILADDSGSDAGGNGSSSTGACGSNAYCLTSANHGIRVTVYKIENNVAQKVGTSKDYWRNSTRLSNARTVHNTNMIDWVSLNKGSGIYNAKSILTMRWGYANYTNSYYYIGNNVGVSSITSNGDFDSYVQSVERSDSYKRTFLNNASPGLGNVLNEKNISYYFVIEPLRIYYDQNNVNYPMSASDIYYLARVNEQVNSVVNASRDHMNALYIRGALSSGGNPQHYTALGLSGVGSTFTPKTTRNTHYTEAEYKQGIGLGLIWVNRSAVENDCATKPSLTNGNLPLCCDDDRAKSLSEYNIRCLTCNDLVVGSPQYIARGCGPVCGSTTGITGTGELGNCIERTQSKFSESTNWEQCIYTGTARTNTGSCSAYCREDVEFGIPNEMIVVKAGRHFVPDAATISGKRECRARVNLNQLETNHSTAISNLRSTFDDWQKSEAIKTVSFTSSETTDCGSPAVTCSQVCPNSGTAPNCYRNVPRSPGCPDWLGAAICGGGTVPESAVSDPNCTAREATTGTYYTPSKTSASYKDSYGNTQPLTFRGYCAGNNTNPTSLGKTSADYNTDFQKLVAAQDNFAGCVTWPSQINYDFNPQLKLEFDYSVLSPTRQTVDLDKRDTTSSSKQAPQITYIDVNNNSHTQSQKKSITTITTCSSGSGCTTTARSFDYNKEVRAEYNKEITFTLPQNKFRYIDKQTWISKDSVSDDVYTYGRYVDVGYGNVPVYEAETMGIKPLNWLYSGIGENSKFDRYLTNGVGYYECQYLVYDGPIQTKCDQAEGCGVPVCTPGVDCPCPEGYEAECNTGQCIPGINCPCPAGHDCSSTTPGGGNPGGGNPGGENPGGNNGLPFNIIYRTIDLNNPFPGFSGETRLPGANWKTANGVNPVTTYITGKTDIFEKEPMYEIRLTRAIIPAIRQYNRTTTYDDFNMSCSVGYDCQSDFLRWTKITDVMTGTKGNLINPNGRINR